jgi:desulfoferrodoxin (superoxide reductase-like protein)
MNLIEMLQSLFFILAIFSLTALSAGRSEEDSPQLHDIIRHLERDYADTINSSGDVNKHTPIVHLDYDRCRVTVPHEMNPSKPHWIQYLWVVSESDNRILGVKEFDATNDRTASLNVKVSRGSTVRAFAFCNEHGLWKSEAMKIPDSDESDEL